MKFNTITQFSFTTLIYAQFFDFVTIPSDSLTLQKYAAMEIKISELLLLKKIE